MKITAYEAKDYKRVEHVRIEPGDRALLVIGGRNGQGKSSLLDGLTAVFGGARQTDADPVRHGADAAELTVELDGGDVLIRRRITAGGTNTLEVFDASGKRRSPQAVLDQLVGQRFLDPLAFLRLAPKGQRDALLGVTKFPKGFSLPRWEIDHSKAYEARRDLGRARKQAEAEAGAPEPPEAPEPVSASSLVVRVTEIQARQKEAQLHHDQVAGVVRAAEAAEAAVERQREVVARAQAHLAALEEKRDAASASADEWRGMDPPADEDELAAELATVREQLADIESTNQVAREAAAERRTWEEAQARAFAARRKHEAVEAKLEALEEQKAAALAAAETPLEDVDIDAAQVLLGGVPFAQASNAEQLRASLAIAMAMSPTIHDVWVKDGSLLDADSLELVRQMAEERDYRVWLERVGDGDPGALIIQAGALKEPAA